MTAQILAAALIRSFEGLRLIPYRDSGGVWTVGYGHTGPDVRPGVAITQEQATEYLARDSEPLFELVKAEPMIAQAAYVSFGYNCGRHALELVLQGKADMLNFVHDRHGNVLDGLASRRALEKALIDSVSPVSA